MFGASESLQAAAAPTREASEPAASNTIALVQVRSFLNELESVALGLRQRSAEREHGVGPGEAHLLQCLAEHGNLTVPELARLRGTSRQNIQIMANRLAVEGCVVFDGNPAHKRSGLVGLSDQGRARLQQAQRREAQLETELTAALSGLELSEALELLQRVRQTLSGKQAAAPRSQLKEPRHRAVRRQHRETPSPQPSGVGKSEASPGLDDQPTDYGLPANLL